jgi:hypothetical protein
MKSPNAFASQAPTYIQPDMMPGNAFAESVKTKPVTGHSKFIPSRFGSRFIYIAGYYRS